MDPNNSVIKGLWCIVKMSLFQNLDDLVFYQCFNVIQIMMMMMMMSLGLMTCQPMRVICINILTWFSINP